MNYNNPELLDRLASEYVLGTLRGGARRRFEQVLRELPEAKAAVTDWENRLAGLSSVLPDEQPSPRVWQHIEQRIQPTRTQGVGFWRGWALVTSLALVAVTGLLVFNTAPVDEREVAFVHEANATPAMGRECGL